VLELVDGPKDMRFAMTAATVARDRRLGRQHTDLTELNMGKVTRFRKNGEQAFEDMVGRMNGLAVEDNSTESKK
jgi:large subunit ribosomal protein L17